MGIERRYTKANDVVIILISNLLEFI